MLESRVTAGLSTNRATAEDCRSEDVRQIPQKLVGSELLDAENLPERAIQSERISAPFPEGAYILPSLWNQVPTDHPLYGFGT